MASGGDGSSVTVNTPSAGTVPNGGQVERAVESAFVASDVLAAGPQKTRFHDGPAPSGSH